MNLIERTRDLIERTSNLADLDEKLDESKKLHALESDADSLSKSLGEQVRLSRLLNDQGIECDSPISVEKALDIVSKLKERFNAEKRADQLTRGKDWTLFKGLVEKVSAEAAHTNKTEWVRFVEMAYTGEKPKDVEVSLALTPENSRNLPLFSRAYSEFQKYTRKLPNERSDFDDVRDTARKLREIYQQFDFSVSESVKLFLKAVGEGGASLDLLTEEVIEWLRESNSKSRYRIVARGSSQ